MHQNEKHKPVLATTMIFFTTVATLSIIATSRLDRVVAQPQLRGSNNSSQRMLNGDSWCPKYFPGSNTECSLTGMFQGSCYYSSSAQADEPMNTNSQACSCNKDGTSNFLCESKPYPGGAPTNPLSATPPGDKWCPEFFPGSNSECPLTGMYQGTCFYSSSAQAGQTPDTDSQACTCNKDGTSEFLCESHPFPDPIPSPAVVPVGPTSTSTTIDTTKWCPSAVPTTGDSCALPAGTTDGTCSFSRTVNGVESNSVCSCTSDSKTFTCVQN